MEHGTETWKAFLADGRKLVGATTPYQMSGRLTRINGLVMEVSGLKLPLGSGCRIIGKKELVALSDGQRESEESWRELLLALKTRGMAVEPALAIGDGALGGWKALPQVFGTTRAQRCWVHKTANVLNKLPKSLHAKAKAGLQDIWMAPNRADAMRHFDHFEKAYTQKYPKATACLAKDRETLLAVYDFPAEHWVISARPTRLSPDSALEPS